jgi:hypothetical protein
MDSDTSANHASFNQNLGVWKAYVESETVDDAIFLLGIVGMPLLVGAVVGYLQRPWWWAAIAAAVVFLLLAIVPPPEEGENRVAGGDVAFLLVASLIVAGLAWVGVVVGRSVARRRVTTR